MAYTVYHSITKIFSYTMHALLRTSFPPLSYYTKHTMKELWMTEHRQLEDDMMYLHLFVITHLIQCPRGSMFSPPFCSKCIDFEQMQMWYGIFGLLVSSHPLPFHSMFGITWKKRNWSCPWFTDLWRKKFWYSMIHPIKLDLFCRTHCIFHLLKPVMNPS